MIDVFIVDDEPLVQIGIQSMLNWNEYGFHICGTAGNGKEALQKIEELSPAIVITDIKMPVMTGLELVSACRKKEQEYPIFIILTSYDDFPLVKQALQYQVLDYLIKLELNADALLEVMEKAKAKLSHQRTLPHASKDRLSVPSLPSLQEKFYIRLLNNLFESEKHCLQQLRDLTLSFDYSGYAVCYCKMQEKDTAAQTSKENIQLYTSSIQMLSEILSRYIPCHIVSLDTKYFCILFYSETTDKTQFYHTVKSALPNACSMLYKYFTVTVMGSTGKMVPSITSVSESYQEARQLFSIVSKEQPLLFSEETLGKPPHKNAFNISIFKNDIMKAFEELDATILHTILTDLSNLFSQHPTAYLQAMDAASNLLYLSITLLPDGERIITSIFSYDSDTYRSIYRMQTVEQVVDWLCHLRDGLCKFFTEQRSTYKNHIVFSVQKYIQQHIRERLTLNEVSSAFGISPNYLSTLFKKYSPLGFNDYVSYTKIKCAKELLQENHLKIYEIADQLGYENAFYFSKVFKKIEGCSPREYLHHLPPGKRMPFKISESQIND